jgi:hypothetical protein
VISAQTTLFVESIEEALRDCVNALKGPKSVGVMLWPELSAELAAKRLHHCLDPDRPEKLELSQVLLIAKKARASGCHTFMSFLASELDYDCKPTDPETAVQRLQREFTESVNRLSEIQRQLSSKTADVQAMRRVA